MGIVFKRKNYVLSLVSLDIGTYYYNLSEWQL